MKNNPHAILVLLVWLPATLAFAQEAAPPDRNAVNTVARPGGMLADSPVTFPERGALPGKYPPDVKAAAEPAEKDYYIFSTPCRSLGQMATASWPGQPWSPTRSRRQVLVTNARNAC